MQYDIAACLFVDINFADNTLTVKAEKHYYYLNTLHAALGEYALVHNGHNFGLVQVIAHIASSDSRAYAIAMAKTKKPLIALVNPSLSLYKEGLVAIKNASDEAARNNAQRRVQAELSGAKGEDDPDNADYNH